MTQTEGLTHNFEKELLSPDGHITCAVSVHHLKPPDLPRAEHPSHQGQPTTGCCKSLIRTRLYTFIAPLPVAALSTRWQSRTATAETVWPAKPTIFTLALHRKRLPTPTPVDGQFGENRSWDPCAHGQPSTLCFLSTEMGATIPIAMLP